MTIEISEDIQPRFAKINVSKRTFFTMVSFGLNVLLLWLLTQQMAITHEALRRLGP